MRPIPPPYLRAEVRCLLMWTAADFVGMAVSLAGLSGLLAWTHHPRLSGLDVVVAVIYALLAFDHWLWARQIEQADRTRGRS